MQEFEDFQNEATIETVVANCRWWCLKSGVEVALVVGVGITLVIFHEGSALSSMLFSKDDPPDPNKDSLLSAACWLVAWP